MHMKAAKKTPQLMKEFDFIEVFNTCESAEANRKARSLAELLGKPGLGGSDAHKLDYVGMSYTKFKNPIQGFSTIRVAAALMRSYWARPARVPRTYPAPSPRMKGILLAMVPPGAGRLRRAAAPHPTAADGGNGRLRAIAPWAIRAGPGRSRRAGVRRGRRDGGGVPRLDASRARPVSGGVSGVRCAPFPLLRLLTLHCTRRTDVAKGGRA